MSDEQVYAFYHELIAFYGDKLANFEYYPRIFAHQVKMYKYYKGLL